jgi:hypothetical protein
MSATTAALLTPSGAHWLVPRPAAPGTAQPAAPTADDRRDRATPPRHHWPLIATAGILAAVAMPTLLAYAFLAGDRAGRTLLLCLGLAALVLAGVAGIAAAAVRIVDRSSAAASDRAVRELRAAAICLHGTLAEQRDRLERVEQALTDGATRPASTGGGPQPAEEINGELVPMPNSRAFQLGRELERRRLERLNGHN